MSNSSPALRRQPRASLATKIMIFVFLSTCVTALVVSWLSIRSTYGFLGRNIEQSFPALLERGALRLEAFFEQSLSHIETMAQADRLQTWSQRGELPPPEDAELASWLGKQLQSGHGFSALFLLDREGRVRAWSGDGAVLDLGPFPALAGVAATLMGTLDAGEFFGAVASTPLRDDQGQALGSLHGLLAPSRLALKLHSDVLGQRGEVYLVDSNGRILASGSDGRPNPRRIVPLERFETEGSPVVRSFQLRDGPRMLGAAQRVGTAGWAVIVQQPFKDAFAPVFSAVKQVVVIDLAILLLFTFVAYQITGAVLRPIEALYHGASRISQGDLTVEIPVPKSNDEIGLLTQTFNDMTQRLAKNRSEIESSYDRVQEQNEELQRANEVLAQLSITDGLTKLHNHRYFQDHLTREIKRVSRAEAALTMLMIDIDDFKRLNDRLGHAAGDELLVRIARILNDSVRETDLLARYGGEEFVVLATGTDRDGAVSLAEKVRRAVDEASFILDDSLRPYRVTISIGVAEYQGNRKDFFEAADRALYRAKAEGKNCVMVAEETV
jgi:diguanylate cyclase (GGDEF)-like protein